MDVRQIKTWITMGHINRVEDAWMEFLETPQMPAEVREVLEALVAAEASEEAQTLGGMMFDAQASQEDATKLAMACEILLAVPTHDPFRKAVCELYPTVHSGSANFDTLWEAAGLEGNQSPRRALRTLKICLAVQDGDLMGNRFDYDDVIRVESFSPLCEYEIRRRRGTDSMDPKKLADEYDVLGENDFRKLCRNKETLEALMTKKPGEVLVSLVVSRGGATTSDEIKETLIPRYLDSSDWSKWWTRARTAARKNPSIRYEGRDPVHIELNTEVVTLEEEFASKFAAAYHPADRVSVLQAYLREAKSRKQAPSEQQLDDVLLTLVQMAERWKTTNPTDALEAIGAAAAAVKLTGRTLPETMVSMSDVLASAADPAAVLAKLSHAAYWPAAIDAMRSRTDASVMFEKLLLVAPASQLERVVSELVALERGELVDAALNQAISTPHQLVNLLLWAYCRKEEREDGPDHLVLLLRLLQVANEVDQREEQPSAIRKAIKAEVRKAIATGEMRRYQEVLETVDSHMAAVIKTAVDRSNSLGVTLKARMVEQLREHHYTLFIKKKVSPWLDESVLWTTEAALQGQYDEVKRIKDVDMPINAKQIGEAAEAGDLRENADWQAAIEERDMLVARVRKINAGINTARIIQITDVPDDHVGIGSRVTLTTPNGTERTLCFLGPWDSNPDDDIYSYTTGLGRALMGKKIGEVVGLELGGVSGEFVVKALASAL